VGETLAQRGEREKVLEEQLTTAYRLFLRNDVRKSHDRYEAGMAIALAPQTPRTKVASLISLFATFCTNSLVSEKGIKSPSVRRLGECK